jgi:hypothetical protein
MNEHIIHAPPPRIFEGRQKVTKIEDKRHGWRNGSESRTHFFLDNQEAQERSERSYKGEKNGLVR